jgi:hypothetical protein
MLYRKLMIALCLLTGVSVMAQTQEAKPPAPAPAPAKAAASATKLPDDAGGPLEYIRPETPEQRQARLGTTEDPGPEPDPSKRFFRFGKWQHIERYDRRWTVYEGGDEGWVRAFGFVNVYRELYRQDPKYVWVWVDEPTEHDSPEKAAEAAEAAGYRKFGPEDIRFFESIRSEFSELTPPKSNTVIRFEDSSEGLPKSGSWRNSMTVADMNGDGKLDLIAPPERAGGNVPVIFLGDGAGHWKVWQVKWPHGLDYGSVTAADFNKDGAMDLAFSVHLNGVYVFLGDGKGTFTDVTSIKHDFPSRRIVAVDVDHDGWMDVVAVTEGPTAVQRPEDPTFGKIRAYLNRDKGTRWEAINVSDPASRFGGDWLSVGNFNGDNVPDFASASIFFNSPETIWLSTGPRSWLPVVNGKDSWVVPYLSYYFASTVGRFNKASKNDEVVVSFARFWPTDLNPKTVPEPPAKTVVGIDRISFVNGQARRIPITRWASPRGLMGVASADFDGDGNLDVMYTRYDPREGVLLVGDGKGGFARATVEGLKLDPNTNYDLRVADVNGDKRPDVIVMYEASGKAAFASRDGSIHVFLNRGTGPAPAAAAK